MPKPKAVVILGAGASVDFGVPPLKGLFKERYARQHLQGDAFLRNNLNNVFWRPRGHTLESSDESLTVEEMLTILRDWELETAACGKAPDGDFCNRFRKSLYVLIKKAIYDAKNTRKEHLHPLLTFCRKHFSSTTWASFNWDCIFESTFWYSQTYYGPGSRSNPTLVLPMADWRNGTGSHTLLKLHGGINWWKINGHLTYLSWGGDGQLNQKWTAFEQGNANADEPVILEPSAYKYESPNYALLKRQWEVFFERLCEADCVIVIGYSLPENDSQARSRITIAGQVNENSRWLVVDPSDTICQRYKRLLGQTRVMTEITTLAGFNNDIEDTLRRAFPHVQLDEEVPAAAEPV
jgi:hypothetical protein